jgi:hypothetical protein
MEVDTNMDPITLKDLMTLEDYDEARSSFRLAVMARKKNRLAPIGPDVVLSFEDRTTILYQVQEMLRIERIFKRAGIQEELDAYNPLIPDGNNWKATMMIQIPDVATRRESLTRLVGIERDCWVRIEGHDRVYAIADEDMERTTEDKTSAVHFLRFELPSAASDSVQRGDDITMGIDHSFYRHSLDPIPVPLASSLRNDLVGP